MMEVCHITNAELKLAEIIWANNPIATPELCEIAKQKLGWKKTTTYTILKRLSDKGITIKGNAVVCVVITREKFFECQSHDFVNNTFNGSLPLFIASFIRNKKLSPQQIAEVRQLIDEHEVDDKHG